MRLVTWNLCRGSYVARMEALSRLEPDVAILQECAQPPSGSDPRRVAWFGTNVRQGVAVVTAGDFFVEAVPPSSPSSCLPSAYAVRIHGPSSFNLLAVWSQRSPTYAGAVLRELAAHRAHLTERPCVVAGDFNTTPELGATSRDGTHADIVRVLESDCGLVSAYHHHFSEEHGQETRPTHYWRWSESHPFHIDFCFVPKGWAPHINSVTVGSYVEWANDSDHRPLVVDVGYDRPR
jgi:hypothetical protein